MGFFSYLTTSYLGTVRHFFAASSVLSAFAVWIGVHLEQEKFAQPTRKLGERILLRALALEFLFGAFLFVADNEITTRQQAEIASLNQKLAPRAISFKDQERILNAVSSFADLKISFLSYPADADSLGLINQLKDLLTDAGFKNVSSGNPAFLYGTILPPVSGIEVMSNESTASFRDKFTFLLNDAGVEAKAISTSNVSDHALLVAVGSKPLPKR